MHEWAGQGLVSEPVSGPFKRGTKGAMIACSPQTVKQHATPSKAIVKRVLWTQEGGYSVAGSIISMVR